jgi:excisionase family DNA binding protein
MTAGQSLAVSADEAGELLGVSADLIYRLCDAHILPELPRVSRRRLIPRRAVEMLVEQAMAGFDPATAFAALRDTVIDAA